MRGRWAEQLEISWVRDALLKRVYLLQLPSLALSVKTSRYHRVGSKEQNIYTDPHALSGLYHMDQPGFGACSSFYYNTNRVWVFFIIVKMLFYEYPCSDASRENPALFYHISQRATSWRQSNQQDACSTGWHQIYVKIWLQAWGPTQYVSDC